jgi:LAS superfamily LD-carboxypeptidase LdcB
MKRLICFILISVLIAGLTGCNKKEDKDTTTSRQSSVTETTEKTSKTTETKNEETKSTKSVLRDDEEPEEKIKKIVLIPVQDSLYPISKYTGYFDIEYEVYIAFKDYLLDSEFDKNGVAVFEKDGNFGSG